MKTEHTFGRFFTVSAATLLVAIWSIDANLHAMGQDQTQPATASGQQTFASPDDAIKALQSAVTNDDPSARRRIFGPDIESLMTGDKVQDANNAKKFSAAMMEGCNAVSNSEDEVVLEIGAKHWPMPIPLVRADGQWHFDTAAGKQRIIERHIGRDELNAIGVCRAYVSAQKNYSDMNPKVGGGSQYALKFKSAPGTKDGLYWPAVDNESPSPFGPLVAEAQSEGYGRKLGTGRHPFHGYYFRILTAQGPAAPGGGMSYMSGDILSGGFALVAYPERWDQSGIMTFIVNQDGKVYEQNLGEKTAKMAGKMKAYNPDNSWTLVSDDGEQNAAAEK